MKKVSLKSIISLFMVITIVISLSACGSIAPVKKDFDTSPTISKCEIYNKDVVITANELVYSDYSADLMLTIENKTDKKLSVTSNTAAYACNSINGYAISDGFFNEDIEGKNSIDVEMGFSLNSLKAFGIYQIADITVGFTISDEDYKSEYTDPYKIKTSIADSYDYSVNTYEQAMKEKTYEAEFDCKINKYEDNLEIGNDKFDILSQAVITNKDEEKAVLIEFKNNTDEGASFSTRDVYINDTLVYDGLWSYDSVPAKTIGATDINIDQLLEEDLASSISKSDVKSIKLTISCKDSKYNDLYLEKDYVIEL